MKDQHDIDIKKLEQQLSDLSPSPLTDGILTRMEAAMVSWEQHIPAKEKIIPFGTEAPQQPATKKTLFPLWSTAAAIAIMGAVAAVFMSDSHSPSSNLASTHLVSATPTATTPEFSHQLTNASNEGITYGADKKPYKVFKIEYTKTIKEKNADGKIITKKVPATELILLPIDVH